MNQHLNQYWYTMLPSFEFLQRKNLIWHLGLFFSQAIMNVIAQLMKVIEKTKMNEKTRIKDTFLYGRIVKSIRLYSLVSIEVRERQQNLKRYFAIPIELAYKFSASTF